MSHDTISLHGDYYLFLDTLLSYVHDCAQASHMRRPEELLSEESRRTTVKIVIISVWEKLI